MNKSDLKIKILMALKEDDDNDTYIFRDKIAGLSTDLKIAQTINELVDYGYIKGPYQDIGIKEEVSQADTLYITLRGIEYLENNFAKLV